MEIDLHWSEPGGFHVYAESIEAVYSLAIHGLKKAQQGGKLRLLFRHGASTSRPGNTTARSQVRKAISSKEATPFILRNKSIQHHAVFLAAIRPPQVQVRPVDQKTDSEDGTNDSAAMEISAEGHQP